MLPIAARSSGRKGLWHQVPPCPSERRALRPDGQTVSRHGFQKKERSSNRFLYPSQVISDQYASKSVLRSDGREVWGIVAPQADGSVVVVTSAAERVRQSTR